MFCPRYATKCYTTKCKTSQKHLHLMSIISLSAIEVLSPSWRGLAGNLFCLPFAVGYMILPGVAYLIRDWKILQLVLSSPSLILFVTWYFLPESPRWLLRKGRVQEAEAILRQAAARNGRKKTLPADFSEMVARIGACVSLHKTHT